MDPKDIIALEEAVYQKEAGSIDGIAAVLIDSSEGLEVLQEALIRGATEAILIETGDAFDEFNTAKILTKIAQQENLELIAVDSLTNKTCYLSAAMIMNAPCQSIQKIPLGDLKLDVKPLVKRVKTERTKKHRLRVRANSIEELIEKLKEKILQAKNQDQKLATAKIVLAGGRGFKSHAELQQLQEMAKKLKMGFGVTGALVQAGYVSHEYQIGQTANIIAPEIYIAMGISGAIQHVVGIENSKIIVAINRNPDAPIFQIADYSLVADIQDILPKLERALQALLDKP